jgi:hypothetical protein
MRLSLIGHYYLVKIDLRTILLLINRIIWPRPHCWRKAIPRDKKITSEMARKAFVRARD